MILSSLDTLTHSDRSAIVNEAVVKIIFSVKSCLAFNNCDNPFHSYIFHSPATGSSGGICEKSKLYSDGKRKSLNTGIITVQNYASHVPPKVSHITFAHEVGHNFGSPVSATISYIGLCQIVQHILSFSGHSL